MSNILPIFTSHYSFGRSILTLDKPEYIVDGKTVQIRNPEDIRDDRPTPIIGIARAFKLNEIFLIDNNFSGFIEAYKNSKDNNIQLNFGLKLIVCNNINDKSDESKKTESKVIIWMKNSEGYKDLIKIYSKAATEGFYYIPRISWDLINEMFTENLSLSIPQYDSFLHKNLLHNCNCIPKFNKVIPNIFISQMELPFDDIIKNAHITYAKDNNLDIIETNPIYYYKSEDFKAYCVFRAINKRGTFTNPNIEYFCSDGFSFESYWNRKGNKI